MANSSAAQMRQAKLDRLVEIEGYDSLDDLLPAAVADSVCPAICCNLDNPECDYTAEMEPDQDRGWCESCGTNTVASALVLAGFI